MPYERELNIITIAVRAGGRLALKMRPSVNAATITSKGGDPRDVLTQVDPAVQELIFEKLRQHFPGTTLIGEEGKSPAELEELAKASDKIVVDPIDGTTNFTRRTSTRWGTTACLILDNEPVAGAIYLPAIDAILTAIKGSGCHVNGRRQTTSGRILLEQAVIGVEWHRLGEERALKQFRLISAARGSHANLSSVYSLYELVQGQIDLYLNIHLPYMGASVWDFAAGHLCVQEMVAPELRDEVAFSPDGQLLSYKDRIDMEALITPYPELAKQVLSLLR